MSLDKSRLKRPWAGEATRQYLGDGANSLGSTFPEHQPLVYVQVLGGLDEAEVDSGLISCAQTVFIHAQNCSCLPDAPTVYCQENQSQDRRELPCGL